MQKRSTFSKLSLALLIFIIGSPVLAAGLEGVNKSELESYQFSSHEEMATIYFYRASRFLNMNFDVDLYVNDLHLGTAVNGTTFTVEVPPGEHDIWLRSHTWGAFPLMVYQMFKFQKGKRYFIAIEMADGPIRPIIVSEDIGREKFLKIIR